MSDTAQRIFILRRTAVEAVLNYEIWWAFRSPDRPAHHHDVMNRYPLLFRTAINAHFVAMLLPLYRLFETRRDSHNLPQLLKRLEGNGQISPQRLSEFRAQYGALKPIWIKIQSLRNYVFGHRSAKVEIDEVFEKARITPSEIRDFINDVQILLNRISADLDDSYESFHTHSGEEAVQMLEDLKRFHLGNA